MNHHHLTVCCFLAEILSPQADTHDREHWPHTRAKKYLTGAANSFSPQLRTNKQTALTYRSTFEIKKPELISRQSIVACLCLFVFACARVAFRRMTHKEVHNYVHPPNCYVTLKGRCNQPCRFRTWLRLFPRLHSFWRILEVRLFWIDCETCTSRNKFASLGTV